MSATGVKAEQVAFTNMAHLAAQRDVYPAIFPGRHIEFTDVTSTVRDLEYAVDRKLLVHCGMRAPLQLDVQERFRDPAAMRFGDITITEFNGASGRPSELYKLCAHLFVYGYYDHAADTVPLAAVCESTRILIAIANHRLPFTVRGNDRAQNFICVRYPDLLTSGAVIRLVDRRGRGAPT